MCFFYGHLRKQNCIGRKFVRLGQIMYLSCMEFDRNGLLQKSDLLFNADYNWFIWVWPRFDFGRVYQSS